MIELKKRAIQENQELISGELRRIREERKIKLSKASLDLGIDEKYLESLELGDISKLPEGIYGKNFLKRYARYLGLDPDKVSKEYFNDEEPKKKKNKHLFLRKVPNSIYFLTVPRLLRNAFLVSLALGLFVYLAFAVYNIISPPDLSIVSPAQDQKTEETTILVSGMTEPEVNIFINDESVLVRDDGSFERWVNLQNGINTIVVSAQRKYSRTRYESRKVLVSESP